ncbi:hypothetical protein A4R35_20250 [Thermogemmatispora tikiterensis]|uniref:Uncharacterized protein n=1 Tax=Thermogemmatispora tikiterensis TaxID=1825093 RepID=A0A328VM28_9CHLR|nr:hypothetical protein A4R35_20250 [Thermogemmatispora tikiterensis]
MGCLVWANPPHEQLTIFSGGAERGEAATLEAHQLLASVVPKKSLSRPRPVREPVQINPAGEMGWK